MVTGGVNKCIKYALFAFNFAFVLIGICLVWIGVAALNKGSRFLHLIDTSSFSAPPKLFIAIGAIMFLIAFLGCCGAWMENHAMIMAYSVLVGLILILQLGVGIAVFLMQDDIEQIASDGLMKSLKMYHNTSIEGSEDIRKSWNMIQSEIKCCGVNNYTDWKGSGQLPLPVNDTMVPKSCCVGGAHDDCIPKQGTPVEDMTPEEAGKYIYTEGCLPRVINEVAINSLGYFGIGLAVVEIVGVLFACMLARSIRFSYETV